MIDTRWLHTHLSIKVTGHRIGAKTVFPLGGWARLHDAMTRPRQHSAVNESWTESCCLQIESIAWIGGLEQPFPNRTVNNNAPQYRSVCKWSGRVGEWASEKVESLCHPSEEKPRKKKSVSGEPRMNAIIGMSCRSILILSWSNEKITTMALKLSPPYMPGPLCRREPITGVPTTRSQHLGFLSSFERGKMFIGYRSERQTP
jgi:hypothetical protein